MSYKKGEAKIYQGIVELPEILSDK